MIECGASPFAVRRCESEESAKAALVSVIRAPLFGELLRKAEDSVRTEKAASMLDVLGTICERRSS